MKITVLILIAVMLILVVMVAENAPPNDNLPIVKVDYQRCFIVQPGPLNPPNKPVLNRYVSEFA